MLAAPVFLDLRPLVPDFMSVREERKQQTRRALMRAALDLMAEGSGFGELSLRSVARRADVVPTAFYRHFTDMEELGLSLVDEAFVTVRRLLRDVRRQASDFRHVIRGSIAVYLNHVESNRDVFAFVARERYGGSPMLRAAIARELRYFVLELSEDLAVMPNLSHLPAPRRETVSHLVVSTVANLTGDVVDIRPDVGPRIEEHAARAVDELMIIALGAAAWKPKEL